jgi:wyosine [tRNA(Phe)-imidazoG37] synthetase (radical SAM superfamily)
MTNYVYGPVPSRRLGQSLGVSPIPEKTCNFNCIYCQLGRTINFTNQRKRFFNPKLILDEISEAIQQGGKIDFITFVGEGEPILCKDLGFLINETKKLSNIPIAVITNGSLFSSRTAREEIRKADLLIPSFDAGNSKLFRHINRPHKDVKFNELVDGLKSLRQEYSNEIWIEVMLLKGINDSVEVLEEIRGFLDTFYPDRVQINIPSRPPAESWVEIPSDESLNLGHFILQSSHVLPMNEEGTFSTTLFKTPTEAILFITKRHPLQYTQALDIIHQFNIEHPEEVLNVILHNKLIKIREFRNTRFLYQTKPV